VVVAVTLAQTTGLLAGGGKTARLAVLVDGVDDPVDAGILADGGVHRVDEDDFVILCSVLARARSCKVQEH